MKSKVLPLVLCLLGCVSLALAQTADCPNGTKRALLIGIGQYVPYAAAQRTIPAGYHPDSRFNPNYSWVNLPSPVDDVQRMKRLVLEDLYDFKEANIRVLTDKDADRAGILKALDQLADDTQCGDTVVFYFAGHGSQRLDTYPLPLQKNKTKNAVFRHNPVTGKMDRMDQTIVPFDAWQGIPDVRDKEMAVPFNRIVYDKKAHLTAIYDSCDSAMQARDISPVISRALLYDDRDVADEKKIHPETVVDADLTRIPQDGNAVFLAASGPNQSAIEAQYPDDGAWHGALTRALIDTLKSSPGLPSADDVARSIQARLKDDHEAYPQIALQQVSVEGQHTQSLFGKPLPPHPLHVAVTAIVQPDGGSSLVFRAVGSTGDSLAELTITRLDGPTESSARVSKRGSEINVGQVFELVPEQQVVPAAAQITVFASLSKPNEQSGANAVKALFPALTWVDDPSLATIDNLVVREDRGWVAYRYDGTVLPPGKAAQGKAYLVPPVPQSLLDQLRQRPPYAAKAYALTNRLIEANYILTTRANGDASEFALMDLAVLAPRDGYAYIHSPTGEPPASGKTIETDLDLQLSRFAPGAALTRSDSSEAVCRFNQANVQQSISLPIRTAWLHDANAEDTIADGCDHDLAYALTRRMVRLGRTRSFLRMAKGAPQIQNWPYQLSLTQLGSDKDLPTATPSPDHQFIPLHLGDQYEVRAEGNSKDLAVYNPDSKYLYLYTVDCAGDPLLLYPTDGKNGVAPQPAKVDGQWPSAIPLFALSDPNKVTNPLGVDTFFLLALSPEEDGKFEDPGVYIADGNLCTNRSRGVAKGGFSDVNRLETELNDSKIPRQQGEWTIQKVVVPSVPK
jgi:hypothetical protein